MTVGAVCLGFAVARLAVGCKLEGEHPSHGGTPPAPTDAGGTHAEGESLTAIPAPPEFPWGSAISVAHEHTAHREWVRAEPGVVPSSYAGFAIQWWRFGYCDDKLCALGGMVQAPSMSEGPVLLLGAHFLRGPDDESVVPGVVKSVAWLDEKSGAELWWVESTDPHRGELQLWSGDVIGTKYGVTDCYPLWSEIGPGGEVTPRPHRCHDSAECLMDLFALETTACSPELYTTWVNCGEVSDSRTNPIWYRIGRDCGWLE